MNYGLMYDGEVVEVFEPPEGYTIDDCFPADRASEYTSIPDHVKKGFIRDDNGNWIAPKEESVTA